MIGDATTTLISSIDYLATEESSPVKREFLGGMVFAIPSHSNLHNLIAGNALGILHNQLRGKPCQPFNGDTKVRIEFPDHTRFYYPDAMVVCQPNAATEHFQDQPVVVIEVLSESTRRTDLGEKRDAYLRLPSLKVLPALGGARRSLGDPPSPARRGRLRSGTPHRIECGHSVAGNRNGIAAGRALRSRRTRSLNPSARTHSTVP
jgi:hypothetical protein